MWYEGVQRRTCLVAGFLMVTAVVLAGCGTTRQLQADGLPGEEYLVGGGLMIDWEAPVGGTAYLVEKETGKIIETRSLKEGDSYSFSVSSGSQAKEMEEVLGINFPQARFLLYFKPAAREE